MDHHDRSIFGASSRFLMGGLSASTAGGRNGFPKTMDRGMLQKYQMCGKVETTTKEMGYSEYAVQLKTIR
jgi:hypothetical protein